MMIVLFIVLARNKLRIPLEGTYSILKMGSYLVSVLIHGDAVYKLSLSRGSGRASVVS
jgi:hypothetical protein